MDVRANHRQQMHASQKHAIFSIDYHSFLDKEEQASHIELANEFGLSLREVQLLKKKLNRN